MENKAKRFLRLLLAIAMVMAIVPMTFALATETDNVAKIGDTEYATLQDAMAEANKAAGDYTITLLKDSAEVFTFAQKSGVNITIDGGATAKAGLAEDYRGARINDNGYAYTGTLTATGDGSVTFKNMKISPTNIKTGSVVLGATVAPDITFVDCVLEGKNGSGNIVFSNSLAVNNTVTFNYCSAASLGKLVMDNQTGPRKIIVENVIATNMIYLLRALKCPSITLNNVTCDAVIALEIKSDAGGHLTLQNVNINVRTYGGQLYVPISAYGTGNMYGITMKGTNVFTADGCPFKDDSWLDCEEEFVLDDSEAVINPHEVYIKWVQDQLFNGKNVTLDRDIVIDDFESVYVPKLTSNRNGQYGLAAGEGAIFYVIGDNVEFDLNGHSITWDAHDENFCKWNVALFRATVEGTQTTAASQPTNFTIKDSSDEKNGSVTIYGNGVAVYSTFIYTTATIEGGTWTNYPCKECGKTGIFIYPSHGSKMNITGGAFQQITAEGKTNQLLGWQGSTKAGAQNYLCTYYDTKLAVSGGTFIGFNPAETRFFDYAGSGQTVINGCAEGYVVVDNNDGTYSVVKDPTYGKVAQISDQYFVTLQDAINACVAGNNTIKLLADISETVNIKQTEGVNIVIEGNGKTYSGTIKVDGNGRPDGAETLTIQNVNFKNTSASSAAYFINAEVNAAGRNSEAHNLTVQNCTFESNNWHYAIGARHPQNLVVKNCTANKVFYLIYIPQGGHEITVDNVTVTGATYGIGAQKATGVYVKDYTYTGKAAGFYGRATSNVCVTVLENVNITTTLNGQAAITLWKNDDGTTSETYTISFKGTNILTTPAGTESFARQSETNSPFVMKLADKTSTLQATANLPITTDVADHVVSYADGKYSVVEKMAPIVTVDGVPYENWDSAKSAIKSDSKIVLLQDIVNNGSFGVNATLDLNGHTFTTTTIGLSNHTTLNIIDNAEGGSVKVKDRTVLYVNGYLNVASDVDFNSVIQIAYNDKPNEHSTGCLLIDGVKWIGRGHFGQEDGIIGTTGGYVTIKNNFQSITFNSGKFFLNDTADFTQFAANEGITVNADATIDLKGKLLKTDAIVCFSELIDTATTAGGVVVSPESISLMQNKTYMPIYDSANGCFRVYEFTMISKGVQQQGNGTVAKFGIAIQFTNVNAYYVLATTENAHLDMTFTLTWENMGELDPLVYTFTGEAVRKWAGNAYTYYSNPNNTKDWALTLTVGGLEKLPEGNHLTIAPAVNSTVKKITFTASSDKIVAAPAVIAQPGGATDATQKNDEGDGEGDSTGAQNQ